MPATIATTIKTMQSERIKYRANWSWLLRRIGQGALWVVAALLICGFCAITLWMFVKILSMLFSMGWFGLFWVLAIGAAGALNAEAAEARKRHDAKGDWDEYG